MGREAFGRVLALETGLCVDVVVPENSGYHFWGPHNKDYSISGSILGSPHFGKLPCPF